jgi:hypothetical protein
MIRSARQYWKELFDERSAAPFELLLYVLLAQVVISGIPPLFQSAAKFRDSAAFLPGVVVRPVGWAAWVPVSLVLSQRFYEAVALIAVVAAICWMLKRGLPWSPALCVMAHGLQTCLHFSMIHHYSHELLAQTALLMIYAAFYTFRRKQIELAGLRTYPNWVFTLMLFYLGTFYMSSGIAKIGLGGRDAFNGLSLQLFVVNMAFDRGSGMPLLGNLILSNRSLASAAMFATVVLECGALIAFLTPRLRPWWALGLLGCHVGIYFAMGISFRMNAIILLWMAAYDLILSRRWYSEEPCLNLPAKSPP